jgi:hypothetical protein
MFFVTDVDEEFPFAARTRNEIEVSLVDELWLMNRKPGGSS